MNIKGIIIAIIYFLIGLYFLNEPFHLLPLPEVGKWMIFIAGILMIFAGIKYLNVAGQIGYQKTH